MTRDELVMSIVRFSVYPTKEVEEAVDWALEQGVDTNGIWAITPMARLGGDERLIDTLKRIVEAAAL